MRTNCILLFCLLFFSCTLSRKTTAKDQYQDINATALVPISIEVLFPGIPAYHATKIKYSSNNKPAFKIYFHEPVVVSVASKPEKWGYFQFPSIYRNVDESITIKWSLNADAIEAYGNHISGGVVSKDGGATWKTDIIPEVYMGLSLANGDKISIYTPTPIKETELSLPKPIGKGMDTYIKSSYNFYKLQDLPESRQGVYFNRLEKGRTEWKVEQAKLFDPQAARYSLNGLIPIVWWGDMQVAADNSLIAGIYPGFLINETGTVDPHSAVFFYRSIDGGHSWNVQGRIIYIPDLTLDSKGNKRMGFTEPAFEILPDGTFICVTRTTDGTGNGPMYVSRSSNLGKTWSQPAILTSSGVLPRILHLQNGVTVLSSGRPGVQLRFSNDGKGREWTNAFEMLPYENYKDQVSCGYTGLLATSPNSFLIVYSDFKYLNDAKVIRKAIKVREVIVSPE